MQCLPGLIGPSLWLSLLKEATCLEILMTNKQKCAEGLLQVASTLQPDSPMSFACDVAGLLEIYLIPAYASRLLDVACRLPPAPADHLLRLIPGALQSTERVDIGLEAISGLSRLINRALLHSADLGLSIVHALAETLTPDDFRDMEESANVVGWCLQYVRPLSLAQWEDMAPTVEKLASMLTVVESCCPGVGTRHLADWTIQAVSLVAAGNVVSPTIAYSLDLMLDLVSEDLSIPFPRRVLFDLCEQAWASGEVQERLVALVLRHTVCTEAELLQVLRLLRDLGGADTTLILRCGASLQTTNVEALQTLLETSGSLTPEDAGCVVQRVIQQLPDDMTFSPSQVTMVWRGLVHADPSALSAWIRRELGRELLSGEAWALTGIGFWQAVLYPWSSAMVNYLACQLLLDSGYGQPLDRAEVLDAIRLLQWTWQRCGLQLNGSPPVLRRQPFVLLLLPRLMTDDAALCIDWALATFQAPVDLPDPDFSMSEELLVLWRERVPIVHPAVVWFDLAVTGVVLGGRAPSLAVTPELPSGLHQQDSTCIKQSYHKLELHCQQLAAKSSDYLRDEDLHTAEALLQTFHTAEPSNTLDASAPLNRFRLLKGLKDNTKADAVAAVSRVLRQQLEIGTALLLPFISGFIEMVWEKSVSLVSRRAFQHFMSRSPDSPQYRRVLALSKALNSDIPLPDAVKNSILSTECRLDTALLVLLADDDWNPPYDEVHRRTTSLLNDCAAAIAANRVEDRSFLLLAALFAGSQSPILQLRLNACHAGVLIPHLTGHLQSPAVLLFLIAILGAKCPWLPVAELKSQTAPALLRVAQDVQSVKKLAVCCLRRLLEAIADETPLLVYRLFVDSADDSDLGDVHAEEFVTHMCYKILKKRLITSRE
ncbi:MAG: uncharacterized protein KVP18_001978 [Porospora cf. gigantea A]|uniref:uncharacterized protein n=1 Tax=Porospora cf. gigantea A TaxID=2853593 RepID=UPI00355A79F9|nr:MAG: hypothetical protein KVP18_001978 [Porospora cf. gigantea A]